MQSSLIPGLDLLNLSDAQTENPYPLNSETDLHFPLFGETLRIPALFSNGSCRSLLEFKEDSGKFSTIAMFTKGQDLVKKRPITIVKYPENDIDKELKRHVNELEIVRNLKHHRILQFHETAVANLTHLSLIFESYSCFLADFILSKKISELSLIKNVMLQLFEALNYMHEKSIVHRYIQPESIAFTTSGCLKVCNFRQARWLWDKDSSMCVEEFRYQSPELLMNSKTPNTSMDIWSAACILAELLLENKLYDGSYATDILPEIFCIFGFPTKAIWPDFFTTFEMYFSYNKEKVHSYNFLPVIFKNAKRPQSENTMDLLQWMFCYDPKTRPTAKECSKHDFFTEEPKAYKEEDVAHYVENILIFQKKIEEDEIAMKSQKAAQMREQLFDLRSQALDFFSNIEALITPESHPDRTIQ